MRAKKKVVYLFGTGASQAEASMIDDTVHLLMSDIKDGILSKMIQKNDIRYKQIRDELSAEYADVEQLTNQCNK